MLELYRFPARPAARRDGRGVWAVGDVALLFLTLMASSDMLVQTGPGQSLVWVLCYAAALLRVAMLWPHFRALLARNRVILAYPMVCLMSLMWSTAPQTTLVATLQLAMTFLIAGYLGWRYTLSAVLRAIFVVLTIAMALSLLHWATGLFPWPVTSRAGGVIGVFSHKNMLGQRALFLTVIIVAIWLMPRDQASRRLKQGAVLAMCMAVLALLLSASMTSVLLMPALTGLLTLLCIGRIPLALAGPVLALALIGVAVGPVLLAVGGVDPVAVVLDAVGKDATLTGRTELWAVAREIVAAHPVLGVGSGAFWTAPEFSNARLMTQHAGAVTSVSFHNFALEILVGTGPLGLLAMAALLFAAFQRFWRLFQRTGSVAAGCALVLLIGVVVTSLLGASLYRAHEFMILLLVMLTVSAGEDIA